MTYNNVKSKADLKEHLAEVELDYLTRTGLTPKSVSDCAFRTMCLTQSFILEVFAKKFGVDSPETNAIRWFDVKAGHEEKLL